MNFKPLANEIDILEIAYKYVDCFHTAIDGGVYLGNWSEDLSKEFYNVCSFEPDTINYNKLTKRFSEYENVSIYNRALGNKDCYVDFRRKSKTGGYVLLHSCNGDNNTVMKTIDSLCFDVGLIKLDLEGAEYLALQGSKKTIMEWQPVIILEDIPRFAKRFGHKPGMALKFLKKMGYVQKYYSYPNYLMVYDG